MIYFLYFIIGGAVVALTSYFGSKNQGFLAAFVFLFPLATVVTFANIYLTSNVKMVSSYAKSLLIFTPVWLVYIAIIWYFSPKIGFYWSLALGILLYVILSFVLFKLIMNH